MDKILKTLSAIVPGKTERMGRALLRDALLEGISLGTEGIGWEFYPAYADKLAFRPGGEERDRWIELEEDQLAREFALEDGELHLDMLEAALAARREVCDFVIAESLLLIDTPQSPEATVGEFVFAFDDHRLTVSVQFNRDERYSRFEVRFAATPEQRDAACRVLQWRRENPSHAQPISPHEPELEPPKKRSPIRRCLGVAVPIVMYLTMTLGAVAALITFPWSSLYALLWGAFAAPAYLFLTLHRYATWSGPQSNRTFWIFGLGFIGMILAPAIVVGVALQTFDAMTLFFTTFLGFALFVLTMPLWDRRQRVPELEAP